MLGFIGVWIKRIIYITLFVIFIPGIAFTLPKGGGQKITALVHGLLYGLAFAGVQIILHFGSIISCLRKPV